MSNYQYGCTPSTEHPGQCAECGEELQETQARYHCETCEFTSDSEFECWQHARDTEDHEAFQDVEISETYHPMDDPDVLAYAYVPESAEESIYTWQTQLTSKELDTLTDLIANELEYHNSAEDEEYISRLQSILNKLAQAERKGE